MQIDTTNQIGQHDAPAIHKERMKTACAEYMAKRETQKRIQGMIGKQGSRLEVNLDDLRGFSPDLAKYIVKNPIEAINMFESQLDRSVQDLKDDQAKGGNSEKQALANAADKAFPTKVKKYYVSFEGNFGANHVTPRGLKANLVNQFVSVQGIVTRMAIVKPKIQTSVHYCEQTKKGQIKQYADDTNLADMAEDVQRQNDGNLQFPVKDKDGNPLTPEYGYCVYKDCQVVTIQEMPENAPPGQLPRSIQVVLENDLVDKAKPGDRVEVNGVFRCRGTQQNGVTNGIFQTQIVATGIRSLLEEKQKPNLSETDIKNIRKMAQEKNILEILGRSMAPTIEGCQLAKQGLLLQLFGGAEKILPNGTHLRGDVNVMMVGDPSTAKSQLLRHVMDIAPLAINTTGRGSTGVGLTAAVTVDKDTGERHLEAGAMVLADRGIVCIDEFDKMNDADRVAIHEVMEQQTVTIAKAGLHTSLNARCSVVAAANPQWGDYQRDQSVAKNINLADSLLSRFDLLFVMLDEKDPRQDRKIAERVITNHRFQGGSNLLNSFKDDYVIEATLENSNNKQDGKGTTVYDKELSSKGQGQVITREFLKKYISFIKSQKPPELTDDTLSYTASIYATFRKKAQSTNQNQLAQPITVRTLETIIRLSTAHAKLRFSKHVEISDVDVAINMLRQTIFQENLEKKNQPDEDVEMEEAAGDDETPPQNMGRTRATNKRARPIENDPAVEEPSQKKLKVDHDQQVQELFAAKPLQPSADMAQKKLVFKIVNSLKDGQSKCGLDAVWKRYMQMNERETMRKGTTEPLVNNKEELVMIVEALEHDNLVMFAQEENQIILM